MSSRAKTSFWLDGGYDYDLVEACAYHPAHRWWVFQLGEVVEQCHNPEEMMVICQGCYVPRCGGTDEADPCMLWRHHLYSHELASGKKVKV